MDNPKYIIFHWTCIFTGTFTTLVVMEKTLVKSMDVFLQNVYAFSKFISLKIIEQGTT